MGGAPALSSVRVAFVSFETGVALEAGSTGAGTVMSPGVPSTRVVSSVPGSYVFTFALADVPTPPVGTVGVASLVVVFMAGGGAPVVSVTTGTLANGSAGFVFDFGGAAGTSEYELVTTGTFTVRVAACRPVVGTARCLERVLLPTTTFCTGAAFAGVCSLGMERVGNATAGTIASGSAVGSETGPGRRNAIAAGLAYIRTTLRVPTAASQ